MIRRTCIQFGWLLLIANILFGCKSKESLPARVTLDSSSNAKIHEALSGSPQWSSVWSDEHETLQIAQMADFGMGCPRAGDPDIDGKYTEGCPQRGIGMSVLTSYYNSIFPNKNWESSFKCSEKSVIDCKNGSLIPFQVFVVDSVFVFNFREYFDSIQVQYRNGVVHLDFTGYVNPENRGYPKSNSEDGIDGDGMADNPETILILKAKKILDKIEMTSPSGVIRGDYLVKNHELIPVSKKSIWPCK
jgi:hypothetical protein